MCEPSLRLSGRDVDEVDEAAERSSSPLDLGEIRTTPEPRLSQSRDAELAAVTAVLPASEPAHRF